MDGNSEQLQVINLKQLPIIEERLRDVKAKIEQRTSAVMALAVTEEDPHRSPQRVGGLRGPAHGRQKGHYDPLRTV